MQEISPYKISKGKKVLRWVLPFVLLYIGGGLALYNLQEKIMFHPKPLPAGHKFSFDKPFKEIFIAINPRDTMNMVQFFPPETTLKKGVVLYFHGNRDNVERYAIHADHFTRHGYEVWMPDYPGFGKSTGRLTEKQIYLEAETVYKLARTKYNEENIVLYGKSLGTGVASYLAANFKCKRLILETPYYSFPSLMKAYLPVYPVERMARFKFPTGEHLKKVKAPVTILHGTKDRVVFYRNASELKAVLKPEDEFITIEGGGHNNLAHYAGFLNALDSLLKKE